MTRVPIVGPIRIIAGNSMNDTDLTRDPDAGHEYYSHVRSDILDLVPAEAINILSVGCGAGYTEAELVKRGCSVVGIEQFEPAAKVAESHGLEIFAGSAELAVDHIGDRRFDCIIYADVLEHLIDPEQIIRSQMELLAPGGVVVISVPNFRHYTVLKQLFIDGEVRYSEAGILDKTHLRITTSKLLKTWCKRSGLKVELTNYIYWRRREKILSAISFGVVNEFVARQVIVRAHL